MFYILLLYQVDMSNYTFRVGRGRGAHARHWQRSISAADLCCESRGVVKALPLLREDVVWHGALESMRGGWHWSGHVTLSLQRECSRCSGVMWWSLDMDVARDLPNHLTVASTANGDKEEREAALDDGRVAGQEDPDLMDLIDLVREEVWLAWQPFVCCSKGCRGLCSKCGQNLNQGKCECSAVDASHPFAALAEWKVS